MTVQPVHHKVPRISIALNAFGVVTVIGAMFFLAGSFYLENEIGRAFCLGAFFSGLLGAILLFGFAKVIDLLDAIREQGQAGTHHIEEDLAEAHGAPESGRGSAKASQL